MYFKKLFVFIACSLVCLATYCYYLDKHGESESDRVLLKDYIGKLFLKQHFGYTLIGAKPMSIGWALYPTPYSKKKRTVILNTANFLFIESAYHGNLRLSTLINKDQFKAFFNQNKDLFSATLGPSKTADALLKEIASSEKDVLEILQDDDALIGILLGFGRENSLLFKRWRQIADSPFLTLSFLFINVHPWSIMKQAEHHLPDLNWIQPSENFRSIEEEKVWFSQHFNLGSDPELHFNPFHFVRPIAFRLRKSRESRLLLKKYLKSKEILSKMFSEGDIVQVVFEQLNSENPLPVK